jgi:SAM-dependent methyltransferase
MSTEKERQNIVDTVLRSPYFPAKLYPTAGSELSFAVPFDRTRAGRRAELPVPPDDWLVNWGGVEVFTVGGRNDVTIMRDVAAAAGYSFPEGTRVLEFGVSRGRMIRWLSDVAERGDVWGVDVVADDVRWCQQFLGEPFHFLTNTSYPYLPFEERSFDFVYAGSVFTHVSDLADAWIMELIRLTRPGGMLYLTFHDNRSVEILHERGHAKNNPWWRDVMAEFDRVTGGKPLDQFETVVLLRGGPSAEQVFYDRDYLLHHLGRLPIELVSIREEAYSAFQTALLLRRI